MRIIKATLVIHEYRSYIPMWWSWGCCSSILAGNTNNSHLRYSLMFMQKILPQISIPLHHCILIGGTVSWERKKLAGSSPIQSIKLLWPLQVKLVCDNDAVMHCRENA